MIRKNIALILATIAVCMAVCYYLYTVNGLYGGGLINSLAPYCLNMPLIGTIILYQLLTKEQSQEKMKKPLWQTILAWCILVLCCMVILWVWIDSRFYDVSCIIALVLMLVLLPMVYLEHKQGRLVKQPIQSWAAGYIAVYLLMAGTVFTYMQVVAPITVEQATSIVAAEHGADSYQFIGHLTGDRSESPLGIYWFATDDTSQRDWIEIDLLTGEIVSL